MPIGTGIIYNVGDLILSTVSGSGTAFLETKIAAATSSIVYFDSNARINSASLNSITVGTASYVSGSTSIITNLTASNISASGTSSFGYVGIGTTVPSAKLEVVNTGRILGVLRLHITPQTTFYDNTFAVGTDGGGANGFIYTSGTGGTFPLDTYGELILQAGPKTGFNNGISLVTGTTSPSVKLRIAEGGNVGIGTTAPGALLHVYTGSIGGTAYPLLIDNNSGGAGVNVVGFGFANGGIMKHSITTAIYGNDYMAFNVGQGASYNQERMRIDSGGAVGIGTTTVSRILHAYVTTGPVMRVQSSGSNASIEFIPSIGHNRYNWLIGAQQNISDAFEITPSTATNGTTFTTPAILVAPSGNIGIGTTSPTQRLDLSGSLRIRSAGTYSDPADNAGFINYDSTGGIFTFSARSNSGNTYMAFRTSNAGTAGERMRIINDGNVGIGTTNPGYKLTVQNDAASTNALLGLQNFSTSATTNHGVSILPILSDNTGSTAITAGGLYWLKEQQWTNDTTSRDSYLRIDTTENGSASEKVRITSAGTVGIGTSVITGLLNVTRNSNTAQPIAFFKELYGSPAATNILLLERGNNLSAANQISSNAGLRIRDHSSDYSLSIEDHNSNVNFAISGSKVLVGSRGTNSLLNVGGAGSVAAASGLTFGEDASANLYRSAASTIKTDGNLVVAGTTSLNGHTYGKKTVSLTTASYTTVLTVNLTAHTSCYVKIGAFGDWGNHSAVAFVSELFIQNGDNAGYAEPGTIITAHDNTAGAVGDKIDIQIVDPLAAGTQNFLIQLKLISATLSTNSSIITYHVMGQQASVT